jgi:putative Holliday junction resolvase
MRALGIDYGTKRIGIAVSDADGRVAFPRAVIANDRSALDQVIAYVQDEEIETIVLGESTTLSGDRNPVQDKIDRFCEAIREQLAIPVVLEPEYLSSNQVRREQGRPGASVDAQAAAVILQSYLDKQHA